MISSSNQRPANRGFRSVLRCAISHYRQSPLAVCTRTLAPGCARRVAAARQTAAGSSGEGWPCDVGVGARAARVRDSRHTTGDGSLSGTKARAITSPLHPALHPATNSAVFPGPTHAVSRVPPPHDGHGAPRQVRPTRRQPGRPCSAASKSGQVITPHPRRSRCRCFRRASFTSGNPRATASRITAETDTPAASASASSAAAVAGCTVTRNCFE